MYLLINEKVKVIAAHAASKFGYEWIWQHVAVLAEDGELKITR